MLETGLAENGKMKVNEPERHKVEIQTQFLVVGEVYKSIF